MPTRVHHLLHRTLCPLVAVSLVASVACQPEPVLDDEEAIAIALPVAIGGAVFVLGAAETIAAGAALALIVCNGNAMCREALVDAISPLAYAFEDAFQDTGKSVLELAQSNPYIREFSSEVNAVVNDHSLVAFELANRFLAAETLVAASSQWRTRRDGLNPDTDESRRERAKTELLRQHMRNHAGHNAYKSCQVTYAEWGEELGENGQQFWASSGRFDCHYPDGDIPCLKGLMELLIDFVWDFNKRNHGDTDLDQMRYSGFTFTNGCTGRTVTIMQ